MDKKKIIIAGLVMVLVAILGMGVFFAYQRFFKKENTEKVEVPAEKNYFEINDETSGIYFHISKNFDRMTAQDLQLKNPVFLYGFVSQSDKSAYCIVSQTKREKPGAMKAADLRDGVLEQVKKSFPDANLDSAEMIEVGDNNKGVELSIGYTDDKAPMIQQEVVGITDKAATFFFCVAPKAVVDLYRYDFDLFLGSVRIK